MKSIVFYGDPHNDFGPLKRSLEERPADCVVVLGDLLDSRDERASKHALEDIQFLRDLDCEFCWIHGNHESDNAFIYDATIADLGYYNLHAGTRQILGGLRIGGLGGVFRGKVWLPGSRYHKDVTYETREDMLRSLTPAETFRKGIPLRHRTTIFPEDVDALERLSTDILITHEAPSTHPHGFSVLDDLAEQMGAKVLVHGHTHMSYEATLYNGTKVVCVGKREVFRIDIP